MLMSSPSDEDWDVLFSIRHRPVICPRWWSYLVDCSITIDVHDYYDMRERERDKHSFGMSIVESVTQQEENEYEQ